MENLTIASKPENEILQKDLSSHHFPNFEEGVQIIFHKHFKLHCENLSNNGKAMLGIK